MPDSYPSLDNIVVTPSLQQSQAPRIEEYGWQPLHTLPKFTNCVEAPVVKSADYTEFFVPDSVFGGRETAINWVKDIAKQHFFVLVNYRVQAGGNGYKGITWLACQRRGQNTPTKVPSEKVRRGSKKCGCKFMIKIVEEPIDIWNVVVVCGTHNHVISDNLHGNALAGRPTEEELKEMREMAEINIRPMYIKGKLASSPDNYTSMKQVYNTVQKFKKEGMEGRTVVQEFFKKCKEKHYFIEYRSDLATNKITDIFFANSDSIRLLKAFPYVMLLDSTYATNK